MPVAVIITHKLGVLITIVGCWWITTSTLAQGLTPPSKAISPKVEVIAKTYLDSVVIRWAPNGAEAWQYGNRYGYIIERATLASGDQYTLTNPPTIILTPQPVRPLPLSAWEPLAQNDKYAAIAAQAIYGESFEVVNPSNSIASFVNQAKENENRFSFALFTADQSVATATAHGLRFVDRSVKPDEKYRYRVRIALPEDKQDAVETGFVFLAANDTASIPAPQQLAVNFGDRVAQLSWNKRYYERIFTSYVIERTDNLATGFVRIEQPPLVNPTPNRNQSVERMYSTDSLSDNTTTYYYRIRGVTAFGELSPPSDTVSGHGLPAALPVAPNISRHTLLPNGQVQLEWTLDAAYNQQLQGFQLLRSDRADGATDTLTTTLLSPTDRTFTDTNPLPVNYYQMTAIDKQGRTYTTFPTLVQLEDSIPPASPTALIGSIDTLGIVTLSWQANTEPDLSGYRVLMSNTPDGNFIQISDALVEANAYTDTTVIRTLTRYIYYKVVATDHHYNRSEPSAMLRLERPDVVPPAAPVFKSAASQDSAIYLSWLPSVSTDVVQHVLYRRLMGRTIWRSLAVLDSTQTISEFQDTSATPGRTYEYTLIAIDRTGLESEPATVVQITHIDNGIREAITEFYSKVDRTAKQVELAWNYSGKGIERYLLFRHIQGQPLRLLKSVSGDRHTFHDCQLMVNTTYTYRLQAIYQDGGMSPLSEELKVQY